MRWSTGRRCRPDEQAEEQAVEQAAGRHDDEGDHHVTRDVREARKVRRRGRATTSVAALSAVLLLSSCGGNAPGVAATIEGDRITDEKVDEFAQVLCSLGGLPGGEGGTPTRTARFSSLQILMANELAADVADVEDVDKAGVELTVESLNAGRESVPEGVRDTFDEVVEEFATAQQAILELGRESLVESGQADETAINEEAAFAEGDRLRSEYAERADIEIDPRYGTVEDGILQPADGSLSVPVSDLAVQGAAEQLEEGFASALPPTQKCG
jgi:hypothetical protein